MLVQTLDGVQYLVRLKDLNVSKNKIFELEIGILKNLIHLERLNISANYISSPDDLAKCATLKSLKIILFYDPSHGKNPICEVKNYQLLQQFYIPSLNEVLSAEINKMKLKRIFYRIKQRIQNKFFKNFRETVILIFEYISRDLGNALGKLEWLTNNDEKCVESKKIDKIYSKFKMFESIKKDLFNMSEWYQLLSSRQIETEFKTFSNHKLAIFERGSDNFEVVEDLLRTKIISSQFYKSKSVEDLRVTQCCHIFNKFSQELLEKIIQINEKDGLSNGKNSFEYVFIAVDALPSSDLLDFVFKTNSPIQLNTIPMNNLDSPTFWKRKSDIKKYEKAFFKELDEDGMSFEGNILICRIPLCNLQVSEPKTFEFLCNAKFKDKKASPLADVRIVPCKENPDIFGVEEMSSCFLIPEYMVSYMLVSNDSKKSDVLGLPINGNYYYVASHKNYLLGKEYKESCIYFNDVFKNSYGYLSNVIPNLPPLSLLSFKEHFSTPLALCLYNAVNFFILPEDFQADPQIQRPKVQKKFEEPDTNVSILDISNSIDIDFEKLLLCPLLKINLSFCNIESLDPLKNIQTLEDIIAHHNSVKNILFAADLLNLVCLDVHSNMLVNGKEIYCLQNCKKLKQLNILNNPLQEFSEEIFLSVVPWIEVFNLCVNEKKLKINQDMEANLLLFENLVTLNLSNQQLKNFTVDNLLFLENLIVDNNELEELIFPISCKKIRLVSAKSNKIKSIKSDLLNDFEELFLCNNQLSSLLELKTPNIFSLDISKNFFSNLSSLSSFSKLLSLRVNDNLYTTIKDLNLYNLSKNIVEFAYGSQSFDASVENTMNILYTISSIKVINESLIQLEHRKMASSMFEGRLTEDMVINACKGGNLSDVKDLTLTDLSLKDFPDLFADSKYTNIKALNLTNNNIGSLQFLANVKQIEILILNKNLLSNLDGAFLNQKNLLVLELSLNRISSTKGLDVPNLLSLKILKLDNNKLTRFDPLTNLKNLKELDLSNNEIIILEKNSFEKNTFLQIINLKGNKIKALNNCFICCKDLKNLNINGNRINNSSEIDHFSALLNLKDVDMASNAFARKQNHRMNILLKLPFLYSLDGCKVTENEKEKIRIYLYGEEENQAVRQLPQPIIQQQPPGNQKKAPVKIMNYNIF